MTIDSRLRTVKTEVAQLQAELNGLLVTEKTRKRGAILRELHQLRRASDPTYHYMSQAGQDWVIDRLLDHKTGGTFVDVGGYDGVTGSNSLFFEQIRGWTGVLVEPVASQIAKARIARKCPCIEVAVAPTDGTASFIAVTRGFTQMSGLADLYDEDLLQTVRDDPRHAEEMVTVETRTLSRILTESGIPHPDFISLDIEGGEVAVLKAFPFDQHRVSFWSIENNAMTKEIADIMRANGYDLIEFAGPDELYRRRS